MKPLSSVTVFQLGSSSVITLPKKYGIKPGTKMSINHHGAKITLEPKTSHSVKTSLTVLHKISGMLKYPSTLTPKQMKAVYDQEEY